MKRAAAALAALLVLVGCSHPGRVTPTSPPHVDHPNPANFNAYELDDSYRGERYLSGYSADAPGPPVGTNNVVLAFGPSLDPASAETVYVASNQANTEVEHRKLITILYDMQLVTMPALGPDEDIIDVPTDKLPPSPPAMKSVTVKVDGTPLAFDYWQDDHGAWIAHARHERTALTLSGSRAVAVESLSLRKVKNVSDYQLPASK